MNAGWDAELPRYATVEWFYREGDEQGLNRRMSGEADYGLYWWDGPQGHSEAWRVSVVHDTGEVYAALERVNTRHGEPRVVVLGSLGPDPGYRKADACLVGWNLVCGQSDSLQWIIDRVGLVTSRAEGRTETAVIADDPVRAALAEARPFVYNALCTARAEAQPWRVEVAEGVLARVDAALLVAVSPDPV